MGLYKGQHEVLPFVPAYESMLQKAYGRTPDWLNLLPETSENQNQNIGTAFLSCFEKAAVEQITQFLCGLLHTAGNFKYQIFLVRYK